MRRYWRPPQSAGLPLTQSLDSDGLPSIVCITSRLFGQSGIQLESRLAEDPILIRLRQRGVTLLGNRDSLRGPLDAG